MDSTPTFRTRLARSLAINTLLILGGFSGLYVAGAVAPSIQQDGPVGVVECWNPHTAQITVEVGECATPVNPYAEPTS